MRALVASVVGLCCACGGLDNRPLVTGAVTGHAVECDSEGVVGVVGDVSTRMTFDSSCGFRIEGLDPGAHELFVAPTGKKVSLVSVSVRATELSQVGEVSGRPGAFARVQVSAPGAPELEGQLTAPDLPLSATMVGRSGMARIGPFPAGCFRLEVTMNGLGNKALMSCLSEGEEKSVDVAY